MGMDYFFSHENHDLYIKDGFPSDLGFFSERTGKYDDNAELRQIEKILNIDLSIFDHMKYDVDHDFEGYVLKISVSNLEEKVSKILQKTQSNPNYHKKIIYQKDSSNDHRAKIVQDYIEKGYFRNDLIKIQNTLDIFSKNGIEKVEIRYM